MPQPRGQAAKSPKLRVCPSHQSHRAGPRTQAVGFLALPKLLSTKSTCRQALGTTGATSVLQTDRWEPGLPSWPANFSTASPIYSSGDRRLGSRERVRKSRGFLSAEAANQRVSGGLTSESPASPSTLCVSRAHRWPRTRETLAQQQSEPRTAGLGSATPPMTPVLLGEDLGLNLPRRPQSPDTEGREQQPSPPGTLDERAKLLGLLVTYITSEGEQGPRPASLGQNP